MTAVEQYTDPYLRIYRRVPPAGAGVCTVCHSGPKQGYSTCYSCSITMGQIRYPVTAVLPISLYEVSGQYWHVLRYYKDHHLAEVRAQLATIVSATIARFTYRHWSCIATMLGGTPTVVTTVPSTRLTARSGEHPLVAAVTAEFPARRASPDPAHERARAGGTSTGKRRRIPCPQRSPRPPLTFN
jgi:hypothetical protein